MMADLRIQLYQYKAQTLASVERTLHWVEVLGCLATTLTAARSHEPALALWSLSALATSLASLYLLRRHPGALQRPQVREPWYAAVRVHRAFAIVAMRRILKDPVNLGSRSYFLKALLVNSSVLPIFLQALIFQLQLPLQALTQALCTAVAVRAIPEYCATLQADGVPASDWERLARIFGRVSDVIMAATVGSRNDYHPSEIPCQVSLSYLVVVCELFLPLLFVYYYDCAVAHWFAARSPGGRSVAQQRAGASASSSGGTADAARAAGRSGSGSARLLRQLRAAAPAPASALCLLCAGVCGVLWDVAVTIHQRYLA